MADLNFDDLLPGANAPSFADLIPEKRKPFSVPMPSPDGPIDFLKTAAIRAGGGLVDLATQGPQGMLRQILFPDIADAEKKADPMSAPGSAAADAAFANGVTEYKPDSAAGRIGLSATTGAMGGGPFGAAGALLGGAGGSLGQGAGELGLPRWAQIAAGFAPALAGKPAQNVAGRFGSASDQAAGMIAKRLARDEAAGGPSASAIGSQLAEADGKPLAIADVAGENVKGLGERIATQPGEARQIATQFLTGRDAGAGPRLIADSEAGLNPGGDSAFATRQQLDTARRTAAAPAYDAFYNAKPLQSGTLAEDHLNNLLDRPSMRSAARRALTIAQEEGRDPSSLGIRFDAEGAASFERVPSWQTMDYLKRGIDDTLNPYRSPITGRLQLDEHGRAINDTLHELTNFMDQETRTANGTSLYAKAREAYSGPSQSMDAMRRGSNIFNLKPEQIAEDMKTLPAGDRDFYRQGAQDALRERIAKTSNGGNEALRIMGNDYVKQQLRPIFGSDSAFQTFMRGAMNENIMAQSKNTMLGNSRTAARLAEMGAQNDGGGVGSAMLQVGGGLAAGEPIAGILGIPKLAKSIRERLSRPSPAVDAEIARLLFNSDTGANQSALTRIMQGLPQGNAYVGPGLLGSVPPAGMLGQSNARR